jgi:3-oxoacyl-(acyl-carrier-protein) synthase
VKPRPAPRRVVVTGLGVVSPAGIGLGAFWAGLQTRPADRRERWVDDFDPGPWLSPKQARRGARLHAVEPTRRPGPRR